MTQFFVVKLTTGETLFTEIERQQDDMFYFRQPIEVFPVASDSGKDMLSGKMWVPFTDDEIKPVPMAIVYYLGPLSSEFISFYGNVVIQWEINKIKYEFNMKLSENPNDDFEAILDSTQKLEKLRETLQSRFGIDIIDSIEIFKEKALEKHKPVIH